MIKILILFILNYFNSFLFKTKTTGYDDDLETLRFVFPSLLLYY